MDPTELIVGSGEVYFSAVGGDGERYVGNTTNFTFDRKIGFVDKSRSSKGIVSRSDKIAVREGTTITWTTDNMSDENRAAWLGGTETKRNVAGVGAQSETFTVIPGRFYQLGLTTFPPYGANDVFGMSIKVDGNFLTDCYIDEVNGRFGIPLSRTDLTGLTATVEYEVRTSKITQINTQAKTIKGALRFISRNIGKEANYFWPSVALYPRDQLQLKGDDWQSLTFEAEALAPGVMYRTRSRSTSPGEQALINEGVNPNGFVVIEGVLSDALMGG